MADKRLSLKCSLFSKFLPGVLGLPLFALSSAVNIPDMPSPGCNSPNSTSGSCDEFDDSSPWKGSLLKTFQKLVLKKCVNFYLLYFLEDLL